MLRRALSFAFDKSLFLVFGAALGLVWANVDFASYARLIHFRLPGGFPFALPGGTGEGGIDLQWLTNDALMAFFFALAGKEIWEATHPGGPFHDLRHAAVPLVATLGGMTGPALLYLAGAALCGQFASLERGWAIPCATDVAFSYMVACLVFGRSHAAIPFLLLLAIADDFGGLIILAVFYTQAKVQFSWLLLSVLAVGVALGLKRLRVYSFWWYLLVPGVMSWCGFALAGLHPALGLLPIIPALSHIHVPQSESRGAPVPREDTLTRLYLFWRRPVDIILGVFGFMNAGVPFGAVGEATFLVGLALIVGKPLGIWSFGLASARVLRMGLPGALRPRDLFVLGCAGGIGFTVALFVAGVAFPPGHLHHHAAKMGSLASFGALFTTLLAAWVLRVGRAPRTLPQ